MQETEVNGQFVMLPDCHPDDRNWLGAQIYNITTRAHEGENLITGPQRYTMLNNYENEYNKILDMEAGIDRESLARRSANIKLRESIQAWRNMRDGKTFEREAK